MDELDRRRWVYLGDQALEAVAYSIEGIEVAEATKQRVSMTVDELDWTSDDGPPIEEVVALRYAEATGSRLDATKVRDGLEILGVA